MLILRIQSKLNKQIRLHSVKMVLLCCSLALGATAEAESTTLEIVEVIGVAPLSSAALSDKLPYAIQTLGKQDIEQAAGYSLAQLLERQAGSVTINSAQNNPLQPDVRLRGFTASPLLGISQGVVVYQNGVRINETFGDTVNWDLLTASTVESMNVVAGSNPVLGLNSVGGAIAIATKNGFSTPEKTIALVYGSHEAHALSITNGASNDRWGYFLALDAMEEEGWRDFSASRALNLYGALSWRDESSELDLYVNGGDTKLHGNGSAPEALLEQSREQVFTHPDITENRMGMASLSFKHWFKAATQLSLNLFYRDTTTHSFNGDGSEFEECNPPFGTLLCDEDGGQIEDQHGNPVSDDFNAINNRSQRRQKSWGGTAQLYLNREWLGAAHHVIVGADYLIGETGFSSTVEFAELTASRSTTGSDLFDAEGFTYLDTENRLAALYLTDTVILTPRLGVTLSARYNSAHVQTKDRSGERPELNGNHSYQRLNSGLGMTYQLNAAATLFAAIHQSSRAPTPVELACAHPDAPCNLPNTFLADPPLNDVVSLSYEIGVRGQMKYLDRWHVGLFHTASKDDILFQTSGGVLSNQGFFTNAADTQRLGLEVNLAGTVNNWRWFANYSYLDATFEDAFVSSSHNHPAAINGVVPVTASDRIPGIPEHNLKLGASYHFTERLSSSFDLLVNSGQYLRGDEANLDDETEAYSVANAAFSYRLSDHLSFTAQVKNLFDKDYETFGLYGEAAEVLEDFDAEERRFLSPGAPRTFWLKLKLRW
jgi:iron complex outermembrane receptor protein